MLDHADRGPRANVAVGRLTMIRTSQTHYRNLPYRRIEGVRTMGESDSLEDHCHLLDRMRRREIKAVRKAEYRRIPVAEAVKLPCRRRMPCTEGTLPWCDARMADGIYLFDEVWTGCG